MSEIELLKNRLAKLERLIEHQGALIKKQRLHLIEAYQLLEGTTAIAVHDQTVALHNMEFCRSAISALRAIDEPAPSGATRKAFKNRTP